MSENNAQDRSRRDGLIAAYLSPLKIPDLFPGGSRQPWFIETGDVHGNGNLIIFTDGSIAETNNVLSK